MADYQQKPYRGGQQRRENTEDDSEGKLFVGGLAWDSDEESIKSYFETFGPVEAVKLKRNKEDTSKHRGFCFVKFASASDADAVLNQREPHFIDGSKVDPKSACPMGVKPEQRTKKIFVGGLQAETTEEKLIEYFSQFGEIRNNIEFAVDHATKKRRGFCFIEFANEGIVDRIVKDKYHEVNGRRLETKRALSKQQQQEAANSAAVSHGRAPISATIAGAYGVQSPYAQPVIYIHPDSLSTAYPMSALGLQGLTTGYTSALETLYTPYAGTRDASRVSTSRPNMGSSRHEPYSGGRKY